MRSTGIPLGGQLYVDRVHGRSEFRPSFGAFAGRIGDTDVHCQFPREPYQERPILRGTRLSNDERSLGIAAEVHNNGLVEYSWWSTVEQPQDDFLFQEWVAATAMNLLLTCDRFRRNAGAPNHEYAIEFEFLRVGADLQVGRWGGMRMLHAPVVVRPNPLTLPRLSLGDRSEIPTLVGILYRDVNNAAGLDVGDRVLALELPAPAA